MAALAKLPVDPARDGVNASGIGQSETRLDPRAFSTITSREEAEYLLVLDHSRGGADPEWTAFLVESFVEFLVWSQRPVGVMTESDADWLIGMLADAPTPTTAALLFALVREQNEAPERLIALALKHTDGRLLGYDAGQINSHS